MAASNVTIDDSSSLIVYDPPAAWSHASGSDAQAYVNSTYHSTAVSGASAKFTFNGTGVWFYGAKKPDYGSFVLVVDNDVSAFSNATATKPAFGQLLGGMSELQMGEHVVSIMSGGTGPFDLDAIVYETIDQQPNAKAHASVVQPTPDTTDVQSSQTSPMNPATQSTSGLSTTPNAVISPSSDVPDQGSASDSPTTPSTSAFEDSPTVPSTADPSASPLVQTDPGLQPSAVPAANTLPASPGDANGQDPTGQPSAIPNVTEPNSSQAERTNDPAIATISKPHRSLPTGAIVGVAIGGAIALLIVAGLILLFLRRRRRVRARRLKTGLPSPALPLQDPETEFGYFFRGQGAMSEKRQWYLGRSDSRRSQFSSDSGATLQGYGGPYKEKDVTELPTPLPPQPAYVRGSSYTTDTATLNGADDGSDITDMYSRMDPGVPVRPPRPPGLRLSV